MFFAPRDKETALGMYSPLYFITLSICIVITIICLFLSRNLKHKTVNKTINIIGVFLWISEFIKMIFVGVTYGIDEVEFLPLYFCSMFMYACILQNFKNNHLKIAGLSFMFYGGIVGAIAFFCYPNACIPNYPLFHYMTLRTFIYHSIMIYVGILIVITRYYSPNLKHFKNYGIFLGITFILAYIMNIIYETDLMYISKPLNIEFVKNIYQLIPQLYPFVVALIQLVVPFGVTALVYKIKFIKLSL